MGKGTRDFSNELEQALLGTKLLLSQTKAQIEKILALWRVDTSFFSRADQQGNTDNLRAIQQGCLQTLHTVEALSNQVAPVATRMPSMGGVSREVEVAIED